MRQIRDQVEFNEALARTARQIYEGVDLIEACKKERLDPNSFAGKLVLADMTLDDIKRGSRFPIHFKRHYSKSEQDEAVRLHLEGMPWPKIACRLRAYESSLSHWLRWMGYEMDDREVTAAFEADQGHNFVASPSEPVVVVAADVPLVLSPPEKPEIVFDGDLTAFHQMMTGHIAHYLRTYFMQIGEEGVAALLYANIDDDKCPRCGGDMRLIVTRDGRDFAGCLNYLPNNEGCPGSTATKLFQGGRLKRAILDSERIEGILANEG